MLTRIIEDSLDSRTRLVLEQASNTILAKETSPINREAYLQILEGFAPSGHKDTEGHPPAPCDVKHPLNELSDLAICLNERHDGDKSRHRSLKNDTVDLIRALPSSVGGPHEYQEDLARSGMRVAILAAQAETGLDLAVWIEPWTRSLLLALNEYSVGSMKDC